MCARLYSPAEHWLNFPLPTLFYSHSATLQLRWLYTPDVFSLTFSLASWRTKQLK
jgi:hypothetical protein